MYMYYSCFNSKTWGREMRKSAVCSQPSMTAPTIKRAVLEQHGKWGWDILYCLLAMPHRAHIHAQDLLVNHALSCYSLSLKQTHMREIRTGGREKARTCPAQLQPTFQEGTAYGTRVYGELSQCALHPCFLNALQSLGMDAITFTSVATQRLYLTLRALS